MNRLRHISLVSIVPLLLSCAGMTPQAADVRQVPSAPRAVATGASEMHPETLYDVLLGEIAAQRGEMEVAASALQRAAERTRDARLAERAAQAALYGRRYEDARRAARLWVELEPANAEARELLATALLELQRVTEAQIELEHLLEAERARGNVEQAYLRIAAVLGRTSAREAAVAAMQRLVARYPDVPAGHFAQAHLAVRAGDLEAAHAAIERALALRPGWEEAALFKARILVSQKNAEEARRFLEEFLRAHPQANNVRLQYARHLIDQKQWEQAREQFKRIVEQNPNDADSIYAVALLALQTNRLDEAETWLKRVLALQPEHDQARLYLGQALEQGKRYAEAARWYSEVRPGEYYVEARARLAIVTGKQGDVEKARALLHAVPTETDEQRVQLILAEEQVLRDARQFREALAMLNKALERMPGHKDLLYARALVAERLDMLDLVESDLRAILAQDPKNANALNALGYTLADRTDRLQEAHELLVQALELKPDDPFILDSMGWLQYRLGNNAEAIKYLKRALGLRNDAEIAAHLGEVLWVTGERREAESVWRRALQDTPDNEVLLDVIKKFKP
ncbi:MAG TPA: tetratricopeptide repeat protein [Burkholderiales bacterium]